MKVVIRAGGIGTRLWPMSKQNNPKQFQKIVGEKTMIRTTYERIAEVLGKSEDLYVSANQSMFEKVKRDIPEINDKNVIIETDIRNTGPAMCLEVCYLAKYCDSSDIIASLTSDDYISDSKAFRELLQACEGFLQENPKYIITPAVVPSYPDSGYTYFKVGEKIQDINDDTIYKVSEVIEKPNEDRCKELISAGDYYCHAGMYIWQLGHIEKLFSELQPEMYKTCKQIVEMMDKGEDMKEVKKLYSNIEKSSIESAITNKADNVVMSVSNRFGWSDLGKWHIIKRILSKKGENLTKGEVVTNSAKNNLVYNNCSKKIVALNDVEDLVIVETDDVLFISSNKNSADAKKLVQKLKEENKEEYL